MSERLFDVEPADERVRFLALLEPFAGLDPAELERVAASVEERLVPAGAAVLVESGLPGTQLYGALVHHEERRARQPALNQHRLARRHEPLLD